MSARASRIPVSLGAELVELDELDEVAAFTVRSVMAVELGSIPLDTFVRRSAAVRSLTVTAMRSAGASGRARTAEMKPLSLSPLRLVIVYPSAVSFPAAHDATVGPPPVVADVSRDALPARVPTLAHASVATAVATIGSIRTGTPFRRGYQ